MTRVVRLHELDLKPFVWKEQASFYKKYPELRPSREMAWEVQVHPDGDVRSLAGISRWLLSSVSIEAQRTNPLELEFDRADERQHFQSGKRKTQLHQLWLYRDVAYRSEDPYGLVATDVQALINVADNNRRLTLEKARALQAMTENFDNPRKREVIPQAVRLEVWQRDRGRCVDCASREKLEFDHVIPIAMGGSNTARNIQLLCEPCNRRKGASLG